MKIIFFGDSLTQGTFGASYVDTVASMLPGHQFINRGVNGDTSLNLYRRVGRDVTAERPDGVFVMIGVNDAASAVEPITRPYYRFAKGVRSGQMSALAFRENMRGLLGKLAVAEVKTWVGLPPIEYNPAQVKALRQMNDYAAEVCQQFGIPTLDLMARLTPPDIPARPPIGLRQYRTNFLILMGLATDYDRRRAAGGFSYSFDGMHLTEAGAQQMADLIVPFLRANGVR